MPNRVVTHGRTVNDLIDDEREWDSHADFVRHVVDVSGELLAQGVVDARERGTLIRSAASSDVGA